MGSVTRCFCSRARDGIAALNSSLPSVATSTAGEGRGEPGDLREARLLPPDQDGEADGAEEERAPLDGLRRLADHREGVAAVGLERLGGEVVLVEADGVGELLQDEQDADGREHPLDDRGGGRNG